MDEQKRNDGLTNSAASNEQQQTQPTAANEQQQTQSAASTGTTAKPKKKNNKTIFGIVIAAVVIIFALIALLSSSPDESWSVPDDTSDIIGNWEASTDNNSDMNDGYKIYISFSGLYVETIYIQNDEINAAYSGTYLDSGITSGSVYCTFDKKYSPNDGVSQYSENMDLECLVGSNGNLRIDFPGSDENETHRFVFSPVTSSDMPDVDFSASSTADSSSTTTDTSSSTTNESSTATAIDLGPGNYTCGTDFQPGTYNITMVSGSSGNLISDGAELNEVFIDGDVESYNGVEFYNGCDLEIHGMTVHLEPAA